jgi:hypothetical protein
MPTDASVTAWCIRWLGAPPVDLLFRVSHISQVLGLRLASGWEVVLKLRAPAPRIDACFQAQRYLWSTGFPCPEPLAGPAPLDQWLATAERFLPGGARLPQAADSPACFGRELARLVARAPSPIALPSLAPPPYWMGWDHDLPGIWPTDPDVDLNAHHEPAWLEEVAARVRTRLLRAALPPVVGHVDWESQNLRWTGRRLHAVHDWDSIAARPEAAIAGAAAMVFPSSGTLNEQATVGQSEQFLESYARARSIRWSSEEWEVAWATGLWVQAYKAKKATVAGDGERLLSALAQEATERLSRAGLDRS